MRGIYKITSPSGSVYIGQSVNIEKRWQAYKEFKKIQKQPGICRSFSKYGIENHKFEVIHELTILDTLELMNELEVYYIKEYKYLGFRMLNIDEGGKNGKRSVETRAKIGLSKIGNKNNLGRFKSIETRKKISDSKKGKSPAWNKGKPWPDSVKEKMHKFPKGNIPHNKGKEHKYHTDASKKIVSENSLKWWKFRKENSIPTKTQLNGNPLNAKLTNQQVIEIKKMLLIEVTGADISRKYKIAQSTVSAIKSGKNFKHVVI